MLRAAALLIVPLLLALSPVGAVNPFGLKFHCEHPGEWHVHTFSGSGTIPETDTAVAQVQDNNLADCNGDGVPADYDGHSEHGFGGAVLQIAPGCGDAPHHTISGGIHVAWGHGQPAPPNMTFMVSANTEGWCGDGRLDTFQMCTSPCRPTIPLGLDGAYTVFVPAGYVTGAIWTE